MLHKNLKWVILIFLDNGVKINLFVEGKKLNCC
jgi:hypothetical protein